MIHKSISKRDMDLERLTAEFNQLSAQLRNMTTHVQLFSVCRYLALKHGVG